MRLSLVIPSVCVHIPGTYLEMLLAQANGRRVYQRQTMGENSFTTINQGSKNTPEDIPQPASGGGLRDRCREIGTWDRTSTQARPVAKPRCDTELVTCFPPFPELNHPRPPNLNAYALQ